MDLITLHRRTVETWQDRVRGVSDDQWDDRTPCADWTVRDLVNHVVGEDKWTVPLVHRSTIADVGSSLDGDVLGERPVDTAVESAEQAVAAVDEELPDGGKVHLSYGDEDIDEYILQLCADHLVHAWDLAAATGGDTRLDPELVQEVSTWFAEREELYRSVGVVGPRQEGGADPQERLLGEFGRSAAWTPG